MSARALLGALVLGGFACGEARARAAGRPSATPPPPRPTRWSPPRPAGAEVWFTLARSDSGDAGRCTDARDRDSPRRRANARAAALYLERARNRERHHDPRPPLRPLPPRRRLSGGSPDRPSGAGAIMSRPRLAVLRSPSRCSPSRGPGRSAQQGIEGQVGRFYQDDGWTVYRLGVSRPLTGPIGTSVPRGLLPPRDGDGRCARRPGLRRDGVPGRRQRPVSRRRRRRRAGLAALAVVFQHVDALVRRRGIRARARVVPARRRGGALARDLARPAGGLRVGGGTLVQPRRRRRKAPRPLAGTDAGSPRRSGERRERCLPLTTHSRATPRAPRSAAVLADSVIATATEVMGRPYEYGGTGADGGGFDCSGLIQYAYGQHGVTLPRTSVEQAREGTASRQEVRGDPVPGDLLTFSNRGGPVTHVGLYIGERQVHSQRHARRAGERAERRRSVRSVVVQAVGGGAADRGVGRSGSGASRDLAREWLDRMRAKITADQAGDAPRERVLRLLIALVRARPRCCIWPWSIRP